jgi:glutaredoxin
MAEFTIYGGSEDDCPHCHTAKTIAEENNVDFEFVNIVDDPDVGFKLGIRTMPTIIRNSDEARFTGTAGLRQFFGI